MDTDMSHHPKFIKDMADTSMLNTNCDIVTGTPLDTIKEEVSLDGIFIENSVPRTANFLADFLLHPGVTDLTGSFRLYTREAIDKVLTNVESQGYAFQMEIIVRAKQLRLVIEEVPITFVDRIYGESKLGTREIVMYLKGLFRLFFTT
jgi:dolichol-phosphate mannosyltransferase